MQYETITSETADDIAVVTLNRPEKYNALTAQMRAELTHAVKAAGESARVVVITGAGKAFCSGQDLGDRASAANLDLERTLRDEYTPLLRAIFDCPVPTIAAVNGPAAGSGAWQLGQNTGRAVDGGGQAARHLRQIPGLQRRRRRFHGKTPSEIRRALSFPEKVSASFRSSNQATSLRSEYFAFSASTSAAASSSSSE